MYSSFNRPRPNAATLGSLGNQTTAKSAVNAGMQAQYKPDFMANRTASGATDQTSPAHTSDSITKRFQQKHADLVETLHLGGGPLTEKQRHEHNWAKRDDPRAAREQTLQNKRMLPYHQNIPPSPPSTPSHPVNFKGPSKRFGS